MSSQSVFLDRARQTLQHPSAPYRASRRAPLDVPERLRDVRDADTDVTAPRTKKGQYLNQSFLTMIANAGSNATFRPPLDATSLVEDKGEEEVEEEQAEKEEEVDEEEGSRFEMQYQDTAGVLPAENYMAQSLPGLKPVSLASRRMHQTTVHDDSVLTSQILVRPTEQPEVVPDLGSQEDDAGRHPLNSGEEDHAIDDEPVGDCVSSESKEDDTLAFRIPKVPGQDLARRVAQIFQFGEEEEVIAKYPCWLLQSVMLRGTMYITTRHICFYAILPMQSDNKIKSGHVAKRGKQNPKYRRYWFVLKANVLSYYPDAADQYFPHGTIDLRTAIAIAVESGNEADGGRCFTITTAQKTHRFQAESPESAKEWTKQLRKVMFRLHNDGDAVKISLPIANVEDIEDNPVVDFADTFRIRVIDNDETYAIDEYFFSFFASGRNALDLLRKAVRQKAPQKHLTESVLELPRPQDQPLDLSVAGALALTRGAVLTTEIVSERAAIDGAFAETEEHLHDRPRQETPDPHAIPMTRCTTGSSDRQSYAPSSPKDGASPIIGPATVTGSQILRGDDIFRSPGRRIGNQAVTSSRDEILQPQSSPDVAGSESVVPPHVEIEYGDPPPELTHEPLARPGFEHSSSSSTLQELMRAGAYPLHKASGIAGLIRTQSQRMGNMLATGSRGYYEKVSGMWAGERVHYDEFEGRVYDDETGDHEDDEKGGKYGNRFRAHFALPASERLQASYYGYLHRLIPVYGKIYIGDTKMCFRGLLPGSRTKMILPLLDVENVDKEKGFRFGYSGLVIVVRGHEELFFEFSRPDARDDCAVTLLRGLHTDAILDRRQAGDDTAPARADSSQDEFSITRTAEQKERLPPESSSLTSIGSLEIKDDSPPILFDDIYASIINFKPVQSMNITCLTIGSRGDVQPYIALCKGFLAEGHKPTIATHAEFEPWIRSHGIDFFPVAGDPGEIMKLCVENDMFTVAFFREATSKFRGWIDELLDSSWTACQKADLLIESPSAMGGIHIAEALQIPYFRAFTMPWTRTRAYPHAFAVPTRKMGGNYNRLTYVMFDAVFWQATAGQINRWRRRTLHLPSTSLERMQVNAVPFLYNFSPAVVAPPLDFSHWIRVTGYWFLDEGTSYMPPPALVEFIAQARRDGKKLVYVGFGSIVVEDPAALTRTVVDAVRRADVRCILSKGWSERLSVGKADAASSAREVTLPPEIHQIKSAPHDWLFARIDAAAHHGGAGTTGASLRAGVPTVIKPFFGDQFFFGQRVEDLGVGRCLNKLNTGTLGRALWEATNDVRMIERAKKLGQEIRSEDGVATAMEAVWRNLEYARELVSRKRTSPTSERGRKTGQAEDLGASVSRTTKGVEESWTLVEDEDEVDEAL